MVATAGYTCATGFAGSQDMRMPVRCTLRLLIARENLRRLESGLPELTQAQIAKDTGLTEAQISNLASGRQRRIDFDTLEKLCRYFKVQPGDLLRFEES
jgi:putative transcriptional regulator